MRVSDPVSADFIGPRGLSYAGPILVATPQLNNNEATIANASPDRREGYRQRWYQVRRPAYHERPSLALAKA